MTLVLAKLLDNKDSLRSFKEQFFVPQHNKKSKIYFCGNSLGLQPKQTSSFFEEELYDWKNLGVDGHFKKNNPWYSFHKSYSSPLAKLVGAKEKEVIAMNSLTVNLHLMLASFYQPTVKKFKILIEENCFSSDLYALKTHLKTRGINPNKAIIYLKPRKKEFCFRNEDIVKTISKNKSNLALILLGGVNYYTGQVFDMELISKTAKKFRIPFGLDLAHAIGNVPLALHQWNVDFAVWCSYKYLNSGPGAVGGCFIHEKLHAKKSLHRLAGWWGNQESSRFGFSKNFKPIETAEGWQISNAPIFNMLGLKASLAIIEQAGFKNMVKKSRSLTTYMELMLKEKCTVKGGYTFKIITPGSIEERGCQLSLLFEKNGEQLFSKLTKAGFVVDWRNPNVIRVAPSPLYNSFEEAYKFVFFMSKYCNYKKI